MRPIAKTLWIAAILLIVPLLVSGCICGPGWWGCGQHQPRRAMLHVYVYDYYTYAPVYWGVVELYELDSWSWDHVGSWSVDRAGYTSVCGGYLHRDDCCGVEELDFLVEAHAPGYYAESIEIELDYRRPSETIYFYLLPWHGRRGGVGTDEGEPPELPPDERPPDRVLVGEPRQGPAGPGD